MGIEGVVAIKGWKGEFGRGTCNPWLFSGSGGGGVIGCGSFWVMEEVRVKVCSY